MRPRATRSQKDPVISLINIVFLILIFFMVAGSLSKPSSAGLSFVQTTDLECCVSPQALAIKADGTLLHENKIISSVTDYLAVLENRNIEVKVLPDKRLPATTLLEIISDLKAAGASSIVVLTEST